LNQLLIECEPVALLFRCLLFGRDAKYGNNCESIETSKLTIENFHSSSVIILIMLFSDVVLGCVASSLEECASSVHSVEG
jgi:hypothetical protein